MRTIAVLGNSIAGVAAIEKIRENDKQSRILFFPLEKELCYLPYGFFEILNQSKSVKKIYYRPEQFYQDYDVTVIDEKIEKISFKRKKITVEEKKEEKKQYEFDVLIIAGTDINKFKDIKGVSKSGVYGLRRLCDVQSLLLQLPLVQTIIIESDSLTGFKTAMALNQLRKEVIWITSANSLLPSTVDAQTAQEFKKIAQEMGIRIIEENAIEEILGDADVKAIRLKTGKVIACQMVVLTEVQADLKLFRQSELAMEERILVDAWFQTNFPWVMAVDEVCSHPVQSRLDYPESYVSVLEQQGGIVAENILNRRNNAQSSAMPREIKIPLNISSFAIRDVSVTLVGWTAEREHVTQYCRHKEDTGVYQKFFLEGNRLVGAVLMNSDDDIERITQLISNNVEIKGEGYLFEGILRSAESLEENSVVTTANEEFVAEALKP